MFQKQTVLVGGLFNNPAKLMLLVFGIALAARIAAAIFIADVNKIFEYQLIASNFVDGHGISWNDWGRRPMSPTSMFPPLYILWCAAFIYIFGQNYLPMFIAQSILGAAAVFPAYHVGRKMFDKRTGLIFATFIAVYPEQVFMVTRAVPEFLFVWIVLVAYNIYLSLKVCDHESKITFRTAVILGLVIGIGTLVREGMILVCGAILIALSRTWGLKGQVWKRIYVPIIITLIVVLTPWIVRNSIAQGRFVPIRSALGMNLWMGNHAEATGSDRTSDGGYQSVYLMEKNRDYYTQAMPKDEVGIDQFMLHEALSYIQEHPTHYMQLTLQRFWQYIWFTRHHELAANKIYRASWIALLAVGGLGLYLAIKRKQLDSVIPATFFLFMLLYIPVIVLPRYRIIPAAIMLLLAGYAVSTGIEWWRARRTPRSVLTTQ